MEHADPAEVERPDADDLALDGNAAAGELESLFGPGATVSLATCAHCGTEQAVARLGTWSRGPGLVLRCCACGRVAIRLVRAPTVLHLDLNGVTRLRIPSGGR